MKACKQVEAAEEPMMMHNTIGRGPVFGVVSYRCITPDGDRIVVEEEKQLVRTSTFFFYNKT